MMEQPIRAVPIQETIDTYRKANELLRSYRKENYPRDTVVQVDHPGQFQGQGIVVDKFECPPDHLAVRISNDNVWWYPIDKCRRIPKSEWEKWITARMWGKITKDVE